MVPFQGESTVNYDGDVACCCLFYLYGIFQMVQVDICRLIDSETIDNEGE